MRIIQVIPYYLPAKRYGGPVYSVHGLAKALVEQGHDVHVFTTNMDGAGESDVPLDVPVNVDGVQVTYYRTERLRRIAWAPRMLRGLRDAVDPTSVLHLHAMFGFPTAAAARLATYRRVPYVLSPHGSLVRKFIREKSYFAKMVWLEAFDRQTVARAARMHVTSEIEYREMRTLRLQVPRMILAPNGVDLSPELDTVQTPSTRLSALCGSGPYAVFLGRISWVKGIDRALRALVSTDVRLLLAGDDDEGLRSKLEQLAATLGVANRITFIGTVDGPDKWALLRGARFLLLPSYSENFGNVVAEAMAVGCPVIVTQEVGAAEVVLRSKAGLVVSGEPELLGAAMQRLWSASSERAQMGAAGRAWVREHLTWNVIAASMAACYREIADEAQGLRR
jgi:glycosyltransferase involved in cell wall biosynthesis